MNIFIRTCSAFSLLSVAMVQFGCAPSDNGDVESTATTESPLVGTVENVSTFPGDAHFESEVAATIATDSASTEYIGYGRFDPDHETTYSEGTSQVHLACQGTNRAGYARRVNGAWERHVAPMPSGVSVLWGEPAMTSLGSTVFLSSLAIPTSRFVADTQTSDGKQCILYRSSGPRYGFAPTVGAGPCIAWGTAPGDLTSSQCLCSGNDGSCNGNERFVGGSMVATAQYVYVAYLDLTTNAVVMYRGTATGGFQRMSVPNLGLVNGRPKLAVFGSTVYLVAGTTPDTMFGPNSLKLAVFVESMGVWRSNVATVGSTFASSVWEEGEGLINRTGFDLKVVPNYWGPSSLYVAMQVEWRDVGTVIQVYSCSNSGYNPPSCGATPLYESDPWVNAYMPTLSTVTTRNVESPSSVPEPNGTIREILSYWSEAHPAGGKPPAQAGLAFVDLSSKIRFWAPDAYYHPIPIDATNAGDQREYDMLYTRLDNTYRPTLVRPMTISTDGHSTSYYDNPSQHVIAVPLGFSAPIAVGSSQTISIGYQQKTRFMFPVAQGKQYRVSITPIANDKGDPDLYMHNRTVDFDMFGGGAGLSIPTCWSAGIGADTCTMTAEQDGAAYGLVYGFSASTFTLNVTQTN